MTSRRASRLFQGQQLHNPEELRKVMRDWFDVNSADGIKDVEWAFIVRIFHRRHVYEHSDGEVDQKYLDDSGDTSVKLKQHIRETREGMHDLLGSLVRMMRNLHNGFHELLPPQGPSRDAARRRPASLRRDGGHGDQDPYAARPRHRRRISQRLAGLIPSAKDVCTPDACHLVHEYNPQLDADAIRMFCIGTDD